MNESSGCKWGLWSISLLIDLCYSHLNHDVVQINSVHQSHEVGQRRSIRGELRDRLHLQTHTHTHERAAHTHTHTSEERALTQHTRADCRKSSNKGVKTSSIVSVGCGSSGSDLGRSVFNARSLCRHSSHYIPPHPAAGMRENPAVPSPIPPDTLWGDPRDYSPPDERGAIPPFIPNEKPLFSVRFGVTCRASNGKCAAARRARVCVCRARACVWLKQSAACTTANTLTRALIYCPTSATQMRVSVWISPVWLTADSVDNK